MTPRAVKRRRARFRRLLRRDVEASGNLASGNWGGSGRLEGWFNKRSGLSLNSLSAFELTNNTEEKKDGYDRDRYIAFHTPISLSVRLGKTHLSSRDA